MALTDVLLIRLPLAIWVGATVLAAAAAPRIFAVVPSRDLAGDVFGAVLARLGALEHALSLLLVLGVFAAVGREGRIGGRAAMTAIGAFLAIAANVYTSMVLRPRMRYYRAQAGSFDVLPEDDPWRRRFAVLHRRSSRVTLFGLLCAAAALVSAP